MPGKGNSEGQAAQPLAPPPLADLFEGAARFEMASIRELFTEERERRVVVEWFAANGRAPAPVGPAHAAAIDTVRAGVHEFLHHPARRFTVTKQAEQEIGSGHIGSAGIAMAVAVVAVMVCFALDPGAPAALLEQFVRPVRGQAHLEAPPCGCVAPDAAGAVGLVSRLLASPGAVRGVVTDAAGARTIEAHFGRCKAFTRVEPEDVASVVALRAALQRSVGEGRSGCVVVAARAAALSAPVRSALKELFEEGKLALEPVVRTSGGGVPAALVLVLESSGGRAALKDSFPHRVVHMLHDAES